MTDRSRPSHEEELMRRALALAREGWGQTAPNPMVGAVVVRDGAVVGEGHHARYGEAHAEVGALAAAGAQARGSTLIVSLEPCRHYGKTPPCTDAIIGRGVRRVVFGASDPTGVAGGGADVLRAAGIEVLGGVLAAESRELNAAFFNAASSDIPWVTLKLAVSIETAISNKRGTTSWLTGPDSRREVHALRAGNDAIAVGVGTILADDPQLTVRDARAPRLPLKRVIFDRTLRTPATSQLAQTARETPTWIVTSTAASKKADALRKRGVELIEASSLHQGLQRLRQKGIQSLLVEGGATLASAMLSEGLVHRLVIFQAPVSLGAGALHAFDGATPAVLQALEQYPILDRRSLGPDVMTTYALKPLG
jgi:diaminohydroxyphosphoribosylaminopyrimidine deaminase/5-amino-6-(5-phosphoribosylamino)uracil reductase